MIALPPQPDATPGAAGCVQPCEPAQPEAPRFDAWRRRAGLARQVANDPDPAKAGTALAQLPREAAGNRNQGGARRSRSAKRRDCKDGIPGGLLAPLYLMLDKKDSGCKW